MSLNRAHDVSASLLWEMLKAYIRGEIISYTAHENKFRKENLTTLAQRISQLDNIYAASQWPDVYKEQLLINIF